MDWRELRLVLLAVVAVLLFPVLGMWIWGTGMMGRWTMGPGMMGYGTGLGLLMLLVLAAGVALLLTGPSRRASPGDAQDILKRRLASGEISREQYEELKQAIRA